MVQKRAPLLCKILTLIVVWLVLYLLMFWSNTRRHDPINRYLVRQNCDTKLKFGDMCPTLYTDLGGKCDLSGTVLDCPDIRHKAKGRMRQAQLVMVRMLRIFHLIATKHNIRYWISAGTLIGAARHKGFIPWDHDVDVELTLTDYIKFVTVGSKDLPEDIFFQNSQTDSHIREAAIADAQLTPKRHPSHPKIGYYKSPFNGRLRDKASCYGYCLLYGCDWHDGLQVDIFVTESKVQDVFPLKEMEFEGFAFPVPKNWTADLQRSYGEDVLKIPRQSSDQQPQILPHPTTNCQRLAEEKVEFD